MHSGAEIVMNVILTAGGIPEKGEPLYEQTHGEPKALLEIAGKPMIQWVLDALGKANRVGRVVIAGLEKTRELSCSKPLSFILNQGTMIRNITAGASEIMGGKDHSCCILCVSSDIPAIQPHIIDWVIESSLESEDDIYYCVISRPDMERRFPDSRRTFFHLRDREICGGDLAVIRNSVFVTPNGIWSKLEAGRKSILRQAAIISSGVLFLYLFRRLTLQTIVERVSRRAGVRGRALLCPFPEAGMDVDKPHHFRLVENMLLSRSSS